MEAFANIIRLISSFLYSYILIALLIAAGLYFTIKTGFIQFRLFGERFASSRKKREDRESISSFSSAYGLHRLPCRNRQRGRRNGCYHCRRRRCRVLDVAHRHHRQCLRLYRIHPRTDL